MAARTASLVCAAVILFLALAPVSGPPPVHHTDKANHLAAFFVLTCLARAGWPLRPRAVVCALAAFGGLIELLQLFTPGHHADPLDLLADLIGIAAGWAAFAGMRLWAIRRQLSG